MCVFLSFSQGQTAAMGTFSELQGVDLDIVSLLRREEEQEPSSQVSEASIRSHPSLSSHDTLLPPESDGGDPFSVSSFLRGGLSLYLLVSSSSVCLCLSLGLSSCAQVAC